MNTPFDAWLAEKRRARKGGIVLAAGSRGRAYKLKLLIPGDFTEATWRGEVRIHPDAAVLEAAFTFPEAVYHADLGKTEITALLPAGSGPNATGSLTLPTDGSTIAVFAFDILCTPAGDAEDEFLAGALPISGRVTV